jgi:hypothetical protein
VVAAFLSYLEETEKKAGAYGKIFNPRWSLFA